MLAQLNKAQLKEKIFMVLLFALFCTIIVSYARYREAGRSYLYLTMGVQSENEVVMAQLFYNIGRGYNQIDSVIEPVYSDNTVQKVSFRLPFNKIDSLRLDPINEAGIIQVEGLEFIGYHGQSLGAVDLSGLTPIRDIDSISNNQKGLLITATSKANPDVSLLVDYPYPFDGTATQLDWTAIIIFSLQLFVILTIGFSIPFLITSRYQKEDYLPLQPELSPDKIDT